jgi:hypothetical protein
MAPDAAADPQPAARNASQRSASHRINRIKSNERQSAHCMPSLTHNTVCEWRLQRHNQTAHRYLPATLWRSRTSQRDTQRRHARANKRSAHSNNDNNNNNNSKAAANSEWMPRVTHMQNSNTTMLDSREKEKTHSRAHPGHRHTPTRKHRVRGWRQRDEMHEQPDVS